MKMVLYIFGALYAALGVLFIIYPQAVINGYKKFFETTSIKVCGVFVLAFGTLIIICANSAKYFWIITLFGLLAQIKGVFILLCPEKAQSMTTWWLDRDPIIWRVIGVIPIILGILIIFLTGF